MIRVIIADDLAQQRTFLKRVIAADDQFELIGAVSNGAALVELTLSTKPDVILTDIQMPEMDGIEAVKLIMEKLPTPILIYSSVALRNTDAIEALGFGALDIMSKPMLDSPSFIEAISIKIRSRLKTLASLKSVRTPDHQAKTLSIRSREVSYIGIGASTGGVQALPHVIKHLNPITRTHFFLTQHMEPNFIESFVEWLSHCVSLPVIIASDNTLSRAGIIQVAPTGSHLTLESGKIKLSDSPPIYNCKPAVDPMFFSLAKYGKSACGVILSGMGRDGAAGLLAMRKAGAITFAQDENSCVVFGMPKVAIESKAVEFIASPTTIGENLAKLSGGS